MFLSPVKPQPSQYSDSSTVTPVTTPPETEAGNLPDDQDPLGDDGPSLLLVPWPGSTFIIRSVSCGRVLTLINGQITLTEQGSRGSFYWVCVEAKGWLGFRNTVSGKFLGHNDKGMLRCSVDRHQGWENFCFRMRPEGGCVLLMTHWDRLWHVGFKKEDGKEKLAKIGDGASDGIVWEFIKV